MTIERVRLYRCKTRALSICVAAPDIASARETAARWAAETHGDGSHAIPSNDVWRVDATRNVPAGSVFVIAHPNTEDDS